MHTEVCFYFVKEGLDSWLLPCFCFVKESLDSWLLPIKLPKSYEDYDNFMKKHGKLLNDDYKNAMKYLRLALYSTPLVSSALLPFIQVTRL